MAKINASSVVGKVVLEPYRDSKGGLGQLRVHTHGFFGGVDPVGVPVEAFPGAGADGGGGGEAAMKVLKYNASSAGMVTFLPEGSQVHMVIDSDKGHLGDNRALLVAALARSCGEASRPERGSDGKAVARAARAAFLNKNRGGKRK